MAIVINGNGIDMGGNPVSNASQIDGTVINENGSNVRTENDSYSKTEVDGKIVGFKNYIINGGFDVWQRGTDNTGGAGYLSADRWRIRGVNSAYSATVNMRAVREAAGVNQLLVKTATTDTGFAWIEQGIEFHKEDIGKTFTISFEIRDADNSLSKGSLKFAYRADGMDVRDGFNVFIENAVNLSTGFTKYSYTFTLPSFSNYVAIGIGLDGIGITSSDITLFRIKNIQLEEGSVATPFEQRPYGLELSLCQRYLPSANTYASGQAYGTTLAGITFPFKVQARINPTGIIASGTFSLTTAGGGNTAATSPVLTVASTTSGTINFTSSSLTAGNGTVYLSSGGNILFTGCEL